MPVLKSLTGRCDVPAEQRFWLQTNKNGPIHPVCGQCWIWIGHKVGGYGKIRVNGIQIGAAKYSYELHFGEVPEKLLVLHRCDTPACVNPAHLFLGTDADNNADKESKGRGNHPIGFSVSEATRAKLSKANKGKVFSESAREKMSRSQIERFGRPEEIEKLKAASKRRWDRYRKEKEKLNGS